MILKMWVKVTENGWVKVREKLPAQVVDRSWKITPWTVSAEVAAVFQTAMITIGDSIICRDCLSGFQKTDLLNTCWTISCKWGISVQLGGLQRANSFFLPDIPPPRAKCADNLRARSACFGALLVHSLERANGMIQCNSQRLQKLLKRRGGGRVEPSTLSPDFIFEDW